MSERFTLTGGARIGRAHATFPFAELYVDRNILKINVSLIGKFIFQPKDIISIEAYGSIPVLGQGIRIIHSVEKYNQKIIFWTFKNPAFVINEIKETGFLENKTNTWLPESEEITATQNQGGFPIKKRVAILAVVLWNALFLYDLVPFFMGLTGKRTPFGNGINLALGLLFGSSIAMAVSERFRKLVLKEGRDFNDIKKSIYFLVCISGILFITYTRTKYQ